VARDINLAARSLGASVLAANDESFGEKENLILDAPADFRPGRYGHKGEIVDGWETRRRGPGRDWVLVRLGSPGVINSVDVDTSFFTGNYPESCVVEACAMAGYPAPEELLAPAVGWATIVASSRLDGDAHNVFAVDSGRRFTHVRLTIAPDGGVARLRVGGRVCLDPGEVDGLTVDLAARALGGVVEASSDEFYSSADVLNLPDLPRSMGEGWETRRRRGPGNDWALIRLAAAGRIRVVEVDTSWFKFNASSEVALLGARASTTPAVDSPAWHQLLPRTRLQPDTRHRFRIDSDRADQEVTHVRLDAFPDGGVARLRLCGEVSADGLRELGAGLHAARG
jgi:allantoicase